MKILRAVLLGALLWILIFFEVSILMFGFKLSEGFIYYTVHYVLLAFFVILVSLIYFRKRGVKGGLGNGFFLGVIMLITGTVLDAAITVPLWVGTYGFFFNVYLWTGYLETLVISTVVGILRK